MKEDKGWPADAPLFPATLTGLGTDRLFRVLGLKQEHWSNSGPIRHIFKRACLNAGRPYFNPHSLRKTLTAYGEKVCRSPEEFKAFSQNLGHEGVMTTLTNYGAVSVKRQTEIIASLGREAAGNLVVSTHELAKALAQELHELRQAQK